VYDAPGQHAPLTYKFTGKECDSESGPDYFGARFDSFSMGRFMFPDPLLNSGQPRNPQSRNRYAYTENNPLRYTDPTGMWKWGGLPFAVCLMQRVGPLTSHLLVRLASKENIQPFSRPNGRSPHFRTVRFDLPLDQPRGPGIESYDNRLV
jgi:RHS repeat-associated protein